MLMRGSTNNGQLSLPRHIGKPTDTTHTHSHQPPSTMYTNLLIVLLLMGALHVRAQVIRLSSTGCQEGFITTPNFNPDANAQYPHNLYTVWIVTGDPGMQFFISFTHFDIEADSDCAYDIVEFYDGDVTDGDCKLYTKCGSDMPPSYITASHVFSVVFHTDSNRAGAGFRLNYFPDCRKCDVDECTGTDTDCSADQPCNNNDKSFSMIESTYTCASTSTPTSFTCATACDECSYGGTLPYCPDIMKAKLNCIIIFVFGCSTSMGIGQTTAILMCWDNNFDCPSYYKCTFLCCCQPQLGSSRPAPAINCFSTDVLRVC